MGLTSASTKAASNATAVLISLDHLAPNPQPPRRVVTDDGVDQLALSIAKQGILQPLVVRPVAHDGGRYEVIAGERRRRAAVKVGLSYVPCMVWEVNAEDALVLSIVENIQREDFHPLDEAWAYDRLIELGIARNRADIARLLGVTRSRITQRMKLLELDEHTKEMLIRYASTLSEYHARLLLTITSLDARHHLAELVGTRGLSGRELRAMIEDVERQGQVEAWRQTAREVAECPRSYEVRLPGMRLVIDYGRVDRARALEALRRAAKGLVTAPAGAEAAAATPVVSSLAESPRGRAPKVTARREAMI